MDSTVKRLMENRIDEVRKKVAIDSLVDQLTSRLSPVDGKSHHKLLINPDYDNSCVEITFEDTDDSFKVYPQKTKISNENSNKVVKVSSIEGAYIDGDEVFDVDGNLIGDALVRMRAIHNKSDYSDSLENAEFRLNSKLTDIRRLEKYIAREAIDNMK